MAVAVCVVVFALAVAAVGTARTPLGLGPSVREVVVAAAAVCGGFLVAITEGLSAIHELRYEPVLVCWCLAAVVAGVLLIRHRFELTRWVQVSRPAWCNFTLLAVIIAVVGTAGLLAVVCPPNNWDVTLYHLPRQLQWAQQASVEHFPTQDYRLTVNPPFAEFVGLHLLLLSGTDRLAAVESWAAMVLTLLAVSLVARELGLSHCGQLLAATFAVTIPVGFHEATNGKNDWMVAFWLATTTFWVLRDWTAERVGFAHAMFAGLSLGLLLLTKGTGGVYAVPVALLGGVALVVRRPSGWLRTVAVVGVLVFALNAPHWHRNAAAYGSVSGETFGLANERHDPAVWASGLLRNVTMHLAGPRDSWNWKVEKAVRRWHAALGVAVEEPGTTWSDQPFRTRDRRDHDDQANAPVHVLLLLAVAPGLAYVAARGGPLWPVYVIAAAGGFVLFCGVFKWQPWHPRLHLPPLALLGVGFGWAFTRPVVRWFAPVAVAALIVGLDPAVSRCEARSLGAEGLNVFRHDADELRFLGRADLATDAREVAARIRSVRPSVVEVINNGPLPWDYPVALWLRSDPEPPRVGYFYPVAGSPTDTPPADLVLDVTGPDRPEFVRHRRTRLVYRATDRVGTFTLYRPFLPGDVWAEGGLRLSTAGAWEPLPGVPHGRPPQLDHPIGRFGIGPELPGESR